SNRELTTVNHIARASATLASGLALKEAVERLALSVSIDSIALFRREDDQLVLAVQQGFPDAWVAEATRVPVGRGTPWGEGAAGGGAAGGPAHPRRPAPAHHRGGAARGQPAERVALPDDATPHLRAVAAARAGAGRLRQPRPPGSAGGWRAGGGAGLALQRRLGAPARCGPHAPPSGRGRRSTARR